MKFAVVVALLANVIAAEACASDILNKDIIVKDFDRAYEQDAAKHDQTVVIFAESCSTDVKTVCTYDLDGDAKLLVSGSGEDRPVEGLSVIYSPQDDPAKLFNHFSMLVWAAEASTPRPKQAKIIGKLLDAATQRNDKPLSFKTDKAEYSVVWVLGTLMMTAQKRK